MSLIYFLRVWSRCAMRPALGRLATLVVVAAFAAPAAAQSSEQTREGASAGGLDVRSYEVGTPAEQLAVDGTPVAAGEGGLFVPSLSRPELEPQVRITLGDELVARGPSGRRFSLPPGPYRVVFGHGPEGWRGTRLATVRAGQTTVATGVAGALRVTAVNRDGGPMAIDYVITSADGHRTYGPEVTADEARYAATDTWILPPGSYRVVPGTDPAARTGVATVFVPTDERVRLRFVTDASGTVIGTEPGDVEPVAADTTLRVHWVVGGSFAFGQAQGQLGSFSGNALRLDALTEFDLAYDEDGHALRFLLDLEQSWFAFDPTVGAQVPFDKLDDQLRFELTYAYRALVGLAPYVRLLGRSALLPQVLRPGEDVTVTTQAADGATSSRALARGESLELMAAFTPAILQQGAGLDVTPWDGRFGSFGLKVGFAARESFFRGRGLWVSHTESGRVTLGTLTDSVDYGPELGATLRVRPASWLELRTDLDGFLSIEDAGVGDSDGFVFNWSSSVSFRIAEWAAIVYRATLHRDDPDLPSYQFRQTVNVRFHYAIF